ncbi:16S rRNA (cytosine(1407)-C(5))-methyltransferase RsmF [Photobacterium sp. ZSDE20]|uniref:Ribosomal RNA small subunit methyltransferase F n=1 Tax=Photobacterium pectinilyticum TaxID=2906793 RepID=A0ABT1N6R4_9GAMM|nr:16S rRNA (cytosine(1407)-C(5))-methyltransferase RsmF [Photobacterium sp. ZSDE20]MCQ1060440.1 16S rRNA (cytosine(1407)-C(5))-methyltransferase RsmF [Photobacterium sp. ZSDE20]MDD1827821.1 16S rRNA (cytosine(1407)-C(5))-methyltransferase RsmF [Photobacterium sp. ZSDE20]
MHPNIHIPDAFIEQIRQIMPEHLSMDEFIAICKTPLRRSIRVNTLKISVESFLERAADKGWTLTPVPWCDTGFWIEREDEESVSLGNTAEHMAGLFYIQEASSMMPVVALLKDNDKLDCVLDMASAPGSKTTQIACAMNNHGALVANELAASRIKVLHSNLQRCGVFNAALTHFDGCVFGSWAPESFDSILLDAPCSGEGAIRKDDDAMANWSLQSVEDIAAVQRNLIISGFQALKPGGVMVYSTCTLNLSENQQVCNHLKETFGDAVEFEPLADLFDGAEKALTEEGFLHVYPQIFDSEGFFVARIRKLTAVESPEVKKRKGKFPFSPASSKDTQAITQAFKQDLDLSIPAGGEIWLRDKEVWLFPSQLRDLLSEIRFQRIGIKLAEQHKKGYRWQHEAIMTIATGQEKTAVALNAAQAKEWFMGRDIRPDNLSGKGEIIVTYRDYPIGIGKWVSNRIKNGLPRELVRDTNLFDI